MFTLVLCCCEKDYRCFGDSAGALTFIRGCFSLFKMICANGEQVFPRHFSWHLGCYKCFFSLFKPFLSRFNGLQFLLTPLPLFVFFHLLWRDIEESWIQLPQYDVLPANNYIYRGDTAGIIRSQAMETLLSSKAAKNLRELLVVVFFKKILILIH